MILVFGTVCVDKVHRVPALPRPGGYVEIAETTRHLGGEAFNTAFALHRWKVPLRLAGNSLGIGKESDWLRRSLEETGLPTNEFPEKDVEVAICDIYVTPDGERTMFGSGFATLNLTSEPSKIDLNGVTHLTLDGNLGIANCEIASRAQAQNIPVYAMDTDDVVLLRPVDFWQTSTDRKGKRGDIQSNIRLVQAESKKIGCFCILSDGANGLVAGGAGHPVRHYPPFPAPSVVDSTGAGDAFRAGMLYGLHQGWDLSKCLSFGSAAGSLNCRALGATDGLPDLAEIEALIAANPETMRAYA